MNATLPRLIPVLLFCLLRAECAAGIVSIAKQGAVADGRTVNTAAFQRAVDECAADGGGTVEVPAGVWVTGSVQLKSHVTLRLENGAILRGSSRLEDYPPNGFHHPEMRETRCLLWAIDQHDIVVEGEGTIELVDRPFFTWDKFWSGLSPADEAKLQDWQRQQLVVTPLARPTQPLFFHHCQRLRWEGVTITHSPCWTLVFSCCDDVRVHAIRIDNDLRVPNNDGIHFTGTSNILVSDCTIRAGDDAIAVSAITDPTSQCENITITNCVLSSHSSALRFGYRAAKVRHVTVSNLVIRDSSRAIFLNAGDDGYVEDVTISNVVLETRMFAGNWWGKGEPLVIAAPDTMSGRIRDITISHVRGSSENSIVLVGDKHNVTDITLNDWSIAYGYSANTPLYGHAIDLSPAPGRPTPLGEHRIPWLYAENIDGLALNDVRRRLRDREKPEVSLEAVTKDVVSR